MVKTGRQRVALSVAAAALTACIGCQREARPVSSASSSDTSLVALTDLRPGGQSLDIADQHEGYETNAFHIAQGQQYYRWFNCSGCHANGGGGMGPALMDGKWRYGGSIEQIHATIVQGRPNGMPAFKDKIADDQIWELSAFVRSLSGNADKLAAPSRTEGMRSIPPINNINRQLPQGSDDASVRGGG
ncbi:MAG: cytochrome c, mono- and diheme variant family [Caulobacteraceae bacterium]|nr:cytochrome c, mono- and diheme variant family [Caulobacteraceae bacterium]